MNQSVQSYKLEEKGYHPFLIRDGWQLAQLNYIDTQHIDQINQLEVHLKTDEIFIALEGDAILIAATILNDEPVFELEYLELNIIYNIPKDVWHNIAMAPGSKVLIVEKSGTHISDFKHFPLSVSKQNALKNKVNSLFHKKKK
jgi:mannose-6-phosphate isomerase-like protein (cupin superfamily)